MSSEDSVLNFTKMKYPQKSDHDSQDFQDEQDKIKNYILNLLFKPTTQSC